MAALRKTEAVSMEQLYEGLCDSWEEIHKVLSFISINVLQTWGKPAWSTCLGLPRLLCREDFLPGDH